MKTLLMILQLLPTLIDALKAVEAIWPDAGKGAEKLSLLQKIVTEVYPDIEKYWPAVEKAISLLVDWFNKNEVAGFRSAK